MSEPVRVQLSRKKGWRMPPNTVKVDRTTRWGNPYNWKLGVEVGNEAWAKGAAVDLFRQWLKDGRGPSAPTDEDYRSALRGKNLACWCRLDQPCHADVLLELANRPICEALPKQEQG